MNNTCIKCIHKDVCYRYRLNYACAREGTCTGFISNDISNNALVKQLKCYEDAYKELHNLELSPQNEDTSGILTCLGIIDKHLKEVPF